MKNYDYYNGNELPKVNVVSTTCKECGTHFKKTAKFCSECGASVAWYEKEKKEYSIKVKERQNKRNELIKEFYNDLFDELMIDDGFIRDTLRKSSENLGRCFGEIEDYVSDTWIKVLKPILDKQNNNK